MKNIITFSICAMLLGLTFANDADARDRRPWYRCAVTVNADAAIINNNCKSGNIVVADVPHHVNAAVIASRLCQYQHQIVTHKADTGITTISCVYTTKRL